MEKIAEFVTHHITDDTTRLILDKAKWPEIDMEIAVNSIESRKKLKGKVPEWNENPYLVFPVKLSAEQCSSSATARYKAALAEHIAHETGNIRWTLADLTGGLGVDAWFFSKKASKVLYNEMQETLCNAAAHNFKVLGADNITISNHAITPCSYKNPENRMEISPEELFTSFIPDIVYMDPARRGEGGRKVFLIEDCTPDVLTLKDEIFGICRNMLIKLSPMADITMVCSRLGKSCREVHVVATGGECKELLIWMDREWDDEYSIIATEVRNDGSGEAFTFCPSQEKEAQAETCAIIGADGGYIFEPGKSLMKAGAFNLISNRLNICKLGASTHYYIANANSHVDDLRKYGKVFRIITAISLDKRNMKSVAAEFPYAEVTARNIPMDTDTLRKKLGTKSGDRYHIFGLRSDKEGPVLIVTEVIRES